MLRFLSVEDNNHVTAIAINQHDILLKKHGCFIAGDIDIRDEDPRQKHTKSRYQGSTRKKKSASIYSDSKSDSSSGMFLLIMPCCEINSKAYTCF